MNPLSPRGPAHALGGLVPGPAVGRIVGQDVEAAQQVVVQQAALDDLVGDAAHKADQSAAAKAACRRRLIATRGFFVCESRPTSDPLRGLLVLQRICQLFLTVGT